MNDIMSWARNIVNKLWNKNDRGWYNINITLNPNPLDCKGVDEVEIEVLHGEDYQHMENSKVIVSAHDYSVTSCVNQINQKVESLINSPKDDDVIVIGNKKFKLVEIE